MLAAHEVALAATQPHRQEARLQPRNLIEVRDRFIQPAAHAMQVAAKIKRVGEIGLEPDRFVEVASGRRVVSDQCVNQTAVVPAALSLSTNASAKPPP